MDRVAPAVSHMVAKNRASHRRLPSHVMRVLAVAAALPMVAAVQHAASLRYRDKSDTASGATVSRASTPLVPRVSA